MKKTTLCFCVRDGQVLLAMKKRGFGEGKWNGYGGKVNDNETSVQAAVREVKEESGLVIQEKDLEHVACIQFFFEQEHKFTCDVYLARTWEGEPVETDEMRPQWYDSIALPFVDMWVADVRWLPRILGGERLDVVVRFDAEGATVKEYVAVPKEVNVETHGNILRS
jgi:8-oxo-dGTP pyrophosphatase MutT (NUDIX family)